MTINEYRERLYDALIGYDQSEVAEAVDYYTELLEDAEDTEAQMESLGTPEELAKKIIADNGWKRPEDTVKETNGQNGQFGQDIGGSSADRKAESGASAGDLTSKIIALICTSPLWIIGFIILFAVFITVFCLYISLPIGAIMAVIGGIMYLRKFALYTPAFLLLAMFCAGITVLLFRPARTAAVGLWNTVKEYITFLFGKHFDKSVFEKKPINKKVFITGIALAAAGVIGVGAFAANAEKINRKAAASMNLQTIERVYDNAKNIRAVTEIGDLTVKPSEDGKTRLAIKNADPSCLDMEKLDASNTAVDLEYQAKDVFEMPSFSIFKLSPPNVEFTLYIPKSEFETVYIESALGDIKIDGITAAEFHAECKCGDIDIANVTQTGSEFLVHDDLGDITVKNCTIAADSESSSRVENNNGDIEVISVSAPCLCVTDKLGDIDLADVKADTLVCSDSCGDIHAERTEVYKNMNCSDALGDITLALIGSDYDVRADAQTGDIDINDGRLSEAKNSGSIPVQVHTDCGDIKVDFH